MTPDIFNPVVIMHVCATPHAFEYTVPQRVYCLHCYWRLPEASNETVFTSACSSCTTKGLRFALGSTRAVELRLLNRVSGKSPLHAACTCLDIQTCFKEAPTRRSTRLSLGGIQRCCCCLRRLMSDEDRYPSIVCQGISQLSAESRCRHTATRLLRREGAHIDLVLYW